MNFQTNGYQNSIPHAISHTFTIITKDTDYLDKDHTEEYVKDPVSIFIISGFEKHHEYSINQVAVIVDEEGAKTD